MKDAMVRSCKEFFGALELGYSQVDLDNMIYPVFNSLSMKMLKSIQKIKLYALNSYKVLNWESQKWITSLGVIDRDSRSH